MKLRTKAIVAFIIMFLIFVGGMLAISEKVLMTGFRSLEDRAAVEEVMRGAGSVRREIDFISSMAKDWAAWDDTYEYTKDRNEEYISSNMVDTTFTDLSLNIIAIVSRSGQVLFLKAIDLESEKEVPVSEGVSALLSPGSPIVNHVSEESQTDGIVLLPEGPLLLVSRPVLKSDYKGPVNGSFIMARYLTTEGLSEIAEKGGLSLEYRLFGDDEMPAGFAAARDSLLGGKDVHVAPDDEDSISAFAIIRDIDNRPALILRASMDRGIFRTGRRTVSYFTKAILIFGLMGTVLIWLVLKKTVIEKVGVLYRTMEDISRSKDQSARIPVRGDDEIAALSVHINNMLEALESAGEEFNREILRSVNTQIAVFDRQGHVTFANDQALSDEFQEDFFGLGRFGVGDSFNDILAAFKGIVEARDIESVKGVISGTLPSHTVELEFSGPAGPSWHLLQATSFSGRGGGAVISIMDITSRKLAEAGVLESLREKELLLKEIHHRVKNNLQVIASILHMMEESTANPDVVEALRTNRSRIHSMAMVHEKLYESDDLSSVHLENYITSLVEHISRSYGKGNISFVTRAEEADLPLDTLIPCGLIINELVTNATRHAFPGGEGAIEIGLRRTDGDYMTLEVRDSGTGLPDGMDLASTNSMGFILVTSLVEQIHGKIEYKNTGGSVFTVTFPIEQRESA